MSNYTSENTWVLATHEQGGNRRMLLCHTLDRGGYEFVIGSYFTETRYDGALGYERWDYSWDWGHYFRSLTAAVEYWEREVLGTRGERSVEMSKDDYEWFCDTIREMKDGYADQGQDDWWAEDDMAREVAEKLGALMGLEG